MTTAKKDPEAGKPSMYSVYCAFKDDRYRLGALVSRDLTKVAIAGLLVFALYIAPPAAATALLSLAVRRLFN